MLGGPPPARFPRDAHAVRIENIAHTVGRHEIIDLFSNLIGQVRRCEEHVNDEDGRYMDMSFFSRDCARKALCMSGYTVSNVPMSVSAIAPSHSQRRQDRFNQPDDRRNLYVLGLPFNLTKTEFTEMFSRFGEVVHSVILATVDNASRRRGFVVMANHGDAKSAMDNLSRAEIKGHVIDVSWAVVQRSQGFLDGGDRNVPSPPPQGPTPVSAMADARDRSTSPFGGYVYQRRESPAHRNSYHGATHYEGGVPVPFGRPVYGDLVSPTSASAMTTLLITNISTLLFATEADLRPLFWPYGDVRRFEVLRGERDITDPSADASSKPPSPVDDVELSSDHERQLTQKANFDETEKLSVIVEYVTAASAAEARAALHGQVYGSMPISVEYYRAPTFHSLANSPTRSIPSLASSLSSAPSSASGSVHDIPMSALNLRDSMYERPKRHSWAEYDSFHGPATADPRNGWRVNNPQVEFTPSSPPHSARSFGGWPEGDRYALPPPRPHDAPFASEPLGPIRRGPMSDRSNNTSPFAAAVFPPARAYSPLGAARHGHSDAQDGENRFGAIARPLSAVARLPPGNIGNGAQIPKGAVSNGNSPPRGIPPSKFNELQFDQYTAYEAGRRAFNSMPDVFDMPNGGLPAPRS